ncbi:MAG: hypothetical protein KF900_14080 [Bacteroidetes bacterium]|nr:hypothetical protein [Bacteroidota bacterium]
MKRLKQLFKHLFRRNTQPLVFDTMSYIDGCATKKIFDAHLYVNWQGKLMVKSITAVGSVCGITEIDPETKKQFGLPQEHIFLDVSMNNVMYR